MLFYKNIVFFWRQKFLYKKEKIWLNSLLIEFKCKIMIYK